MSDILLSSEKQSHFERVFERVIREEFDEEADVLVRSNGRVFVRAKGSKSLSADVVQGDSYEDLLDALQDAELEFRQSSYQITDGGESLVGASFYLRREGW